MKITKLETASSISARVDRDNVPSSTTYQKLCSDCKNVIGWNEIVYRDTARGQEYCSGCGPLHAEFRKTFTKEVKRFFRNIKNYLKYGVWDY